LLAHVLVSKYADHLPLYRLSQIFAREGVDIDRSTMADWVGRSTALLEPLADAIGRIVRQGAALFADDTPVKMLAPGNKKTKTARVWTYVRDERPWSGQSPPCVWYQFTVDRKGEHPVSHLLGYKGWVHADGYSGFNGLFGDDKADEMACMAHVRRKFVDVFASQGSAIAEEAIRRIALLYAIEKEIRGMAPEYRAAVRQARAKPIFDQLEEWLHAQLPRLSGKSPLAQAFGAGELRMRCTIPSVNHFPRQRGIPSFLPVPCNNAQDWCLGGEVGRGGRRITVTMGLLNNLGHVAGSGVHRAQRPAGVRWIRNVAMADFLRFMAMAVRRACIFVFSRPLRMALFSP
jgi:hypothetical protein